MTRIEPEKTIRSILDACADCDTCRFLMDESCLLFPELYQLYDKEKEAGIPVKDVELRKLAELCTLCGLCPCPNIRADVIRGKTIGAIIGINFKDWREINCKTKRSFLHWDVARLLYR